MRILVHIPARGGSKGVQRKNLRTVGGISLVGRAARIGKRFLSIVGHDGTVLIDSDSPEIADEGVAWGGVAPFLREKELSSDVTPMMDVCINAINRANAIWGQHDVIVLLQPTSPLRSVEDVTKCWTTFLSAGAPVLSISRIESPVEHVLVRNAEGRVNWKSPCPTIPLRRQDAEEGWRVTGAVYIASVDHLLAKGGFMTPGSTIGVSIHGSRSLDVDTEEDLLLAEAIASNTPPREMRIGSRLIGNGHPAFIIAEAGVNHNGSEDMAHSLIEIAATAGVDAVKFQTFIPEAVVSPAAKLAPYQAVNMGIEGHQSEMIADLVLSRDAHFRLRDHALSVGLQFLSSPFDRESADLLEALDVPAFKVASGELTNHPFLAYLARKGKPLLVSTGMATLAEVGAAIEVILANGNPEIALFHCVTSYPAEPWDSNLRAILTMRNGFGVPTGFSDHTLGIDVAVVAVSMGAALIEKHFTIDRTLRGPDHKASLLPTELRELVKGIRSAEQAMGDGVKQPRPCELPIMSAARRSLHAGQSLLAGHILEEADLTALRPGDGIPPTMLRGIVGKALRKNKAKYEMLKPEDIDEE